jgi:hypothetical protein
MKGPGCDGVYAADDFHEVLKSYGGGTAYDRLQDKAAELRRAAAASANGPVG